MKKFSVEILYQTSAGNAAAKRQVIESVSHSDAMVIVSNRVSSYKRCAKILGGNCVEVRDV